MIDKHDVRMPEQSSQIEDADETKIENITKLLTDVSKVESKQELRLKEDYYSRFMWFGGIGRNEKSYFSYQEEAVYDFVFNLNKSGILSDQVGMGKTIEAGMIISELASRNELRSLLIIVPNDMMAQKWEYELAEKFGIKKFTLESENKEFPAVKTLRSIEDFYLSVFECYAYDNGFTVARHNVFNDIDADGNNFKRMEDALLYYFNQDIQTAISDMNAILSDDENIVGFKELRYADGRLILECNGESVTCDLKLGSSDAVKEYLKENSTLAFKVSIILKNNVFAKKYADLLPEELKPLYTLIGEYLTTQPRSISNVASGLCAKHPILVVPISYTEESAPDNLLPFLNHTLAPSVKNYKHEYFFRNVNGAVETYYESYKVIDFLIDVGYQTLIVDEVHDYIDVCAKIPTEEFHNRMAIKNYSSKDYNRYELFDDYYFIKKSSLYKKLKVLADQADRKIFLTATPIKSDMVDFYLLTLLACNKDAENYNAINSELDSDFAGGFSIGDIETSVQNIYINLTTCIRDTVAQYFCDHSNEYLKEGRSNYTNSRYMYPYFHNNYLVNKIVNDVSKVQDYLYGHLSYLSMQEVMLNLLIAYYAETKHKSGTIKMRIDDLNVLLSGSGRLNLANRPANADLCTRVVFRALLDNPIKLRFEEDFTDENGNAIKRIRELLKLQNGPRKWHNTYRKYGIRHTRHQTYNLNAFKDDEVKKLLKRGKFDRYVNLPVWPKRNGKVIFLRRIDQLFDNNIEIRADLTNSIENTEIRLEDLPNYDRLEGDETSKLARFNAALKIFNFIDMSMSGGSEDAHKPQNSYYDSVGISDDQMAEYKLALVNRLMAGSDETLGKINGKVLLFAEEDSRDEIVNWFKYQKCEPLYNPKDGLDDTIKERYNLAWKRYDVSSSQLAGWRVSESTEDLNRISDNLLVIIDPKKYEKGVDLQKANTIINFDINYCPLKMEQRIGRIDRIRPNDANQNINIISFVPLNDMSGFVINFFANELKMFTQWMGETTGIVSVPEEKMLGAHLSEESDEVKDLSFEGKVGTLEKYYLDIYKLCTEKINPNRIKEMANDFSAEFGIQDVTKTLIDFEYINLVHQDVETVYRNCVRSKCLNNAEVVRFNSSQGPFVACPAAVTDCKKCRDYTMCKGDGQTTFGNSYSEFCKAVKGFLAKSAAFYAEKIKTYTESQGNVVIHGKNDRLNELRSELRSRCDYFENKKKNINMLPKDTDEPFVIPMDKFRKEILQEIRKPYWTDVVQNYLKLILDEFYKQCDSVLDSAKLFEKFIKTLTIAEFMNNMVDSVITETEENNE